MIIILNIISIAIMLLNVFFLKNTYFGFVSLILWLLISGFSYKQFLGRFFKNIKFSYLLGILASFYILCFFGSIFVLLYKITPIFFVISLILATLLPLLFIKKEELFSFKIKPLTLNSFMLFRVQLSNLNLKPNINLIILLFGVVIFSGLILFYLFKASSGDYNIYQFKNTFPLLWILFSALISFVLIYIFKFKSDANRKYFIVGILLIVFTSFIFHSTLPILYKAGFGGDRIRHAATEKYLQNGNIFTPSLFGAKENVSLKSIGSLKVPEVLVVGNKQSYVNKWTSDIFISWITNIEVINIDKYLVFILWSIFIPILFINIFRNFSEREDMQLFFALSSSFLSNFIIYGSISQPISFGFVSFLFILMLFLNKIKNEDFSIKSFFVFFILSMIFLYLNYIVFIAIFLILFSSYILFNKINSKFKLIYIPLFSLLIPILDLASKQTHIINQSFQEFLLKSGAFFSNLFCINDLFKNLYDSSRNFIYFKFIYDIDKLNIPWIVGLSMFFASIFILITVIGLINFYKNQEKYRFIVLLFLSSLTSYFIAFTCLDGVRIFAKRIEIVISLFLLVFFSCGVLFLLEKIKNNSKSFVVLLIIFCSLFSVSTLFSGPIMENATISDFKSAKWIVDKVSKDENYCIIGNTWPLLALEYESGRNIVAGGFPQGLEFSQNERVFIFNEMIKNPRIELLDYAKQITGANKCYFMVKNKYIKDVLGSNVDVYVQYKKILSVFKSNKDIDDVKIFSE